MNLETLKDNFLGLIDKRDAFNLKKKVRSVNARTEKRIRVPYLMKYRPLGSGVPFEVNNLKDISAGGLRFTADKPFDGETLIEVHLIIPPLNAHLETLAKVQRSRRAQDALVYYVSAVFVSLDEEKQNAIRQFIEMVERDSGDPYLVHHPEVVERVQTDYSI